MAALAKHQEILRRKRAKTEKTWGIVIGVVALFVLFMVIYDATSASDSDEWRLEDFENANLDVVCADWPSSGFNSIGECAYETIREWQEIND